jgi:hypothetical protein
MVTSGLQLLKCSEFCYFKKCGIFFYWCFVMYVRNPNMMFIACLGRPVKEVGFILPEIV